MVILEEDKSLNLELLNLNIDLSRKEFEEIMTI